MVKGLLSAVRCLLSASCCLLLSTHFSLSYGQKSCCQIISDNWQQLQVVFSTGDLAIGEVTLDGRTFSTLSFDGSQPAANYGEPQLPLFSQLVEVPLCEGFKVRVSDAVYDTLEPLPHLVVPTQLPRSKSDTSTFRLFMHEQSYLIDAFLDEDDEARVDAVGIARDRRLARLQFAPMRYNPVTGQVIVCRRATVTVTYRNADADATKELFERYHTPAFNSATGVLNSLYPKSAASTAPIRYLIVAHSMFHGQMDSFVDWKRRKGFITDIVYTDDPGVGTDTTAIAAYIKSQYINATPANPAPTYLLLVGDNEQIPAFMGVTDDDHITDLYYATWTTGDYIPDCYYGRFSAQTISQLTPQVEKTLTYEQYTFPDPSFLDRAVMVAGVDGGSYGDFGYTHADPAMDYAITHYVNGTHGFSEVRYFKNDVSIAPTDTTNVHIASSNSSMSATVRYYYNAGAGFINYSAHGGATGWGTPNFTTTHVASMTNNMKFGLMIGNCCLTNKFQVANCLGESLLRKNEYAGAVGYIGGSNSTTWGEDFYWAVGVRSGISATMSLAYDAARLGVYDRSFHTHGEGYADWCLTQGEIVRMGNMTVESSTSSLKHYYWEIYHLMGDPSVMPYFTQADTMPIAFSSVIFAGITDYNVTVVPHAYVALTDTLNHNLIASGWADALGNVTLSIPSDLTVGGYELTASAQGYRTAFRNVTVVPMTGSYVVLSSFELSQPLAAASTSTTQMTVANIGVNTAYNIVVRMTSGDSLLSLSADSVVIDSLQAGSQAVLNVLTLAAAFETADNLQVPLLFDVTWDSSAQTTFMRHTITIAAPVISASCSGQADALLPSASGLITVTLSNTGHAPLTAKMELLSPTSLFSVTAADTSEVTLPAGGNALQQFILGTSPQLPGGIFVPLTLSLSDSAHSWFEQTHPVYIGNAFSETFEGNQFNLSGWSQGRLPWVLDDSIAYSGIYSARSARGLNDYDTSTLTLTATIAFADSISFYYKVSSEEGYDKLHFSIDGTERLVVSGDVDWHRAAYPVSAGTHTFVFSYSKDVSYSVDNDCAWIDQVLLPATTLDATFRRDSLCQGELYVVGSDTIATDSLLAGSHVATMPDGSLVLTDYRVFPQTAAETEAIACDSYEWNDILFTASADTQWVSMNHFGCDSVNFLHLVINYSVTDTVRVTTDAPSYLWNDSLYSQSGSYTLVLSTVEGCDSTVTLLLNITSGIEGAERGEWIVESWPNPTPGVLHLSAQVNETVLYDAAGREVLRRRDVQSIDLGKLPQGVYLLRLTLPGGTTTQRIVKQ